MIEESARILDIRGEQLLVEAQPSDACGSCKAQSACGQGLLSKYFNQTPGQIALQNKTPTGASLALNKGDFVIIGVEEKNVLHAAFFAYLLPLLVCLLSVAFTAFSGVNSEPVFITVAIAGLLLGVQFSKWLLSVNQVYLQNLVPVLLRKSNAAEKIQVQQLDNDD